MKTINKMIMMFVCLLLPIGAGAQDTHWTCDTHAYEYDMAVYFTLSIDGSVVDNMSNYEVAAFCGDVCRGISKVLTAEKDGHETTYGYIRIRSNQAAGETINFKVYVKDTSRELDIEDFTLTFQSQKAIGLPSNPLELHIPYFIVGDADGDGSVSVTDIAVVVNSILMLPNTNFSFYGADANGDNHITVTDIGVIVDIILGHNANSLEPQ